MEHDELFVDFFAVITCIVVIYESPFVLSRFFSSGVEKCHRDDFKRFWRGGEISHCKQTGVFACNLSLRFVSCPADDEVVCQG